MFNLFATVFVVGAVSSLIWLERQISRFEWKALSPFVLLTVPYAVVFFVQVYSIALYKLEPVSPIYLACLLIHFFVVWLVCVLFEGQAQEKHPGVADVDTSSYDRYIPVFLVVGIVVSLVQIVHFLNSGRSVSVLGQVVQEEFQNEYSGGMYFYLRLMSMMCAAYLIAGFTSKRKMLLPAGVFCLIPVFLTFVKSVVIISIIAGIIGNIIVNKRNIRSKQIIVTCILGVVVFFGVYLVEICIWDLSKLTNPETYEYIFAKMNFYLISGPQSFNMVIGNDAALAGFHKQITHNLILAPVSNILHWFGLADRVDTVCPVWTYMGFIPGYGVANGNVYSIIGEYVLYCGLLGSILAEAVFTSIVCYFYCAFHTTGNSFYLLAYCVLGAFFALGWFDDYFAQTFWVYMLVMLGILYQVTRLSFHKRETKTHAHAVSRRQTRPQGTRPIL